MLISSIFVATGLILIVRGWVRIYFAAGEMAYDGIYRYMRHPQYTEIFLAIFGQLVHWPTIPTLVLSPFIVMLYVGLAQREERRMIEKFGPDYLAYRKNVGMFFPHFHDLKGIFAQRRFH